MEIIKIRDEYIKLDQFLKFVGIADNGGFAHEMVDRGMVKYNGEITSIRRKKLYENDTIEVEGYEKFIIAKEE